MEITVATLADEAAEALAGVAAGLALSQLDRSLIRLGVAASVPVLSNPAIAEAISEAFREGATPTQIQEIISLVSGLGVHSLMIASTQIIALAEAAGHQIEQAYDARQQALWDQYVGDDPFWRAFDEHTPGFLDAMLRLSPDQFEAFFTYCAVPWNSGSVRARLKELVALATDATPAHRFLPGFRLHLRNAIQLGVGKAAIDETLSIAAEAPLHSGTRFVPSPLPGAQVDVAGQQIVSLSGFRC